MNDRFKFRGVLTVEYGGENADEKTVDLIIEKADAIHSGSIGFDIDQLDAAIEKAGITDDIEIDNIHEFCYDNNGCRSDEYFVMDGDIEQCTGLKDRNGNLMYENDIVSARGGDYKIVWADTECSWAIQHTKTKLCRSMNCFDGDEFIIQNTGDKK